MTGEQQPVHSVSVTKFTKQVSQNTKALPSMIQRQNVHSSAGRNEVKHANFYTTNQIQKSELESEKIRRASMLSGFSLDKESAVGITFNPGCTQRLNDRTDLYEFEPKALQPNNIELNVKSPVNKK